MSYKSFTCDVITYWHVFSGLPMRSIRLYTLHQYFSKADNHYEDYVIYIFGTYLSVSDSCNVKRQGYVIRVASRLLVVNYDMKFYYCTKLLDLFLSSYKVLSKVRKGKNKTFVAVCICSHFFPQVKICIHVLPFRKCLKTNYFEKCSLRA